jgi:hypothetical protein
MSVTSIQFIGLFVIMANSGVGLHILLPHFPDSPYADHVSMIQYNPSQVSSTTWPGVTACGPNDSLRCAPIVVETITFAGAVDPSPKDIVGDIPHLRCCCVTMTDILPRYKDPAATDKLSAHIFITQGIAEAITGGNGRTDSWVTMHSADPIGITVSANAGMTGSFNIVFKPGAQFMILNSVSASTAPSHFLAYYLMGIGSSTCTSVPSDGPPCAPRAAECAVPKTPAKKPTASKAGRSIPPKSTSRLTPKPMAFDSDCSNTHWP